MFAKRLNCEVTDMARLKTPPVTVVQGDDAPDIVITLQQDSSGTAYVLTDRAAFVVIVDTADPTSYVAKYGATIEDADAGKVRISWLKDPIELTSYLEDLEPGKRYEIQVFLGRTNLPPSFIDVDGYYPFFNGKYLFSGLYQEGSPIFKHEIEDLFLSRSAYSGGNLGDYVWLVTSLKAAPWGDVKDQDKFVLGPEDLTEIPLWNYRQVLTGGDVEDFATAPDLSAFETDGQYVITPDGKFVADIRPVSAVAQSNPSRVALPIADDVDGYAVYVEDNTVDHTRFSFYDPSWYYEFSINPIEDGGIPPDVRARNTNAVTGNFPPQGLYAVDGGGSKIIQHLGGDLPVAQFFTPTALADISTDIENRGTQTVLTQIPLIVKPAYRLADAD